MIPVRHFILNHWGEDVQTALGRGVACGAINWTHATTKVQGDVTCPQCRQYRDELVRKRLAGEETAAP